MRRAGCGLGLGLAGAPAPAGGGGRRSEGGAGRAAGATPSNIVNKLEIYAGVDLDAVALDAGRVLELRNAVRAAAACSAEPVRRYGAPDLAALAATARRLLLLCIDHVRPQPSAHPA